MKKCKFVALATCFVAVSATADSAIVLDTRMPTPAPVKHEVLLKHFGGEILNEKSGSGTFAFINAQKDAGLEPLNAAAERIRADLMIRTSVCSTERPAFDKVDALLREIGANAGVIVVNDETLPTLLVAPECRWAFVNVAGLSDGGTAKEVRDARLRKEIIRAFAFVGGGRPTRSLGCVMNRVEKPADLDKLPRDTISMEIEPDIVNHLEKFGIKPFQKSWYAAACQEGWAPAPTNEYQKAIWEKVHAIPDKPMKIQFDPAAQKGKVTK